MKNTSLKNIYLNKIHPLKYTQGLLERLRDGVVTGDGGYVMALEKRGFVKAGNWTPEAVVEHPEAGRVEERSI